MDAKYKIEARLGEGAQSCVFLASDRQTNQQVAIKQIKSTAPSTGTSGRIPLSRLAANFREIAIMQKLVNAGGHPNIIELVEVIFDDNCINIVMKCGGMNLSEFIARSRGHHCSSFRSVVAIPLISNIVRQVTRGLEFIHDLMILHRDLKPQNILIDVATATLQVKARIADFGLSKSPTFPIAPETVNVASLWYRAPELVIQSGYDVGMDMWSLGCILGELATGSPLFIEASEFGLLIKIFQSLGTPGKDLWPAVEYSENVSTKWPKWDPEQRKKEFSRFMIPLLGTTGLELLLLLLQYDSNRRPRCSECLSHQFLAEPTGTEPTAPLSIHSTGYSQDSLDLEIGDLSNELSDFVV